MPPVVIIRRRFRMTDTSQNTTARTLRARYVFGPSCEPIPNGYVSIRGERIESVGSGRPPGAVEDLGNVAILPGLVNAHTHLEFSHLEQPLGTPGIGMTAWIRRVIEHRHEQTGPLVERVERGLRESVELGTTTLGEIAQPGWPVGPFQTAPLEATVFMELIAPTLDRVEAARGLVDAHLESAAAGQRWRAGLGPHAPYSVHPDLLGATAAISAARRVPLAFHLAESREELELMHR